MTILKQHETGVSVGDLAREHGSSTAMIYQRQRKCGGTDASLTKRMKMFEAENARLRKTYAEERIKAEIRKEALEPRAFTIHHDKSRSIMMAQQNGDYAREVRYAG